MVVLISSAIPSKAGDTFLSKYKTIDDAFNGSLNCVDPDRDGLEVAHRLELVQDLCDSKWTVHVSGICRRSTLRQDVAPAKERPVPAQASPPRPPLLREFCDRVLLGRVQAKKSLEPVPSMNEAIDSVKHWIADQKAHGIISVHYVVVARQSDMRWAGSINYSCQRDLCDPLP
jgi:hypothetical protein